MESLENLNQKGQVEYYINRFGSITSLEAFQDLGITRLSAVIYDLKKEGYEIHKIPETSLNRFGRKVSFDRYYFADSDFARKVEV